MKHRSLFLCAAFVAMTCSSEALPAADLQIKTVHYTSQGRGIETLSYTLDNGKPQRPIHVLYGSVGEQKGAQTSVITHAYCRLLAEKGYQIYAIH